MRIYVGQSRARKLNSKLTKFGFGECTCRGELPPRRRPWFFDNGAFRDWKAGKEFDSAAFSRDLERIRKDRLTPDFIVAPDIVGGGMDSYKRSVACIDRLRRYGLVYLAVQDGMVPGRVDVSPFSGIFVGGTLEWKIQTGRLWVDVAHGSGKACHVGRVGTMRRVDWARSICADSIDSSLPLWSDGNLERFVRAVRSTQLFLATPQEGTE